MDKVEKIRNEIERLHGNPYYMMAIKDVLSIIDSPQEENSFDAHIQEGDKITVNENGSRFNRSQLERVVAKQEEPVSEELEEELTNYFNKFKGLESSNWNWRIDSVNIHSGGLLDFARHFVEWQKQKMMKDAIEREIKEDAGGYPFIEATELYDYDNDKPLAKAGDKIKVVFIKDK